MALTENPVAHAISLLQLQSGERILELGCGDGWVCRLLAERIPDGLVIGLDPSNDLVREARAKSTSFENILYLWSEAEQIPWQEDFFTRVLCVDAANQFQDLEKVLRETYRVLAPGGTFWIVDQRSAEQNAGDSPSERPAPAGLAVSDPYSALLRSADFEEIASRSSPEASASPRKGSGTIPTPASALILSARKPKR